MNKWRYVQNKVVEAQGWFLWKHADGFWQVTDKEEDAPSDASGGYYSLNVLLLAKGI